jgi:tRNA modification GTPase
VEQIGVERSRAAAESADLTLLVFDGSEPLTAQDRRVSEELWAMGFGSGEQSEQESDPPAIALQDMARRPVVLIVNKSDCRQLVEIAQLRQMWPGAPLIHTSMLTSAGIAELEEHIANLVLAGKTLQSESALITSTRHQESLRHASEHIRASLLPLREGLPLDFVSIDLRAAYDALGEVTGETASEDLLERIFHEFCIGK